MGRVRRDRMRKRASHSQILHTSVEIVGKKTESNVDLGLCWIGEQA